MQAAMPQPRRSFAVVAAGSALAALLSLSACAQTPPASTPPPPAAAAAPAPENGASAPVSSAMDGRLMYQLLVAEMALAQGDAGTAYEWTLDAARRSRDETLFRRAVEIAMNARAGEQALAATRAWRLGLPESAEPLRLQVQILLALNRPEQVAEPLGTLLSQTPAADRPGLIAALPRFLQRPGDPSLAARVLDETLAPYRDEAATRVAVRVAQGRAWLQAGDGAQALTLAREAQALDASAAGPVLLALELMREQPAAEELVHHYLALPNPQPSLRLAYVRALTSAQRYNDAVTQLEVATRAEPANPGPWLSLGALHLELKHPQQGEAALQRYIELAQQQAAAAAEPADEATAEARSQGLVQAWLMLAQSAEQRGDFAAAEQWLSQVTDPQRALEVQTRRASILARQGRLPEARLLIQSAPEQGTEDARAKLVAEAGILREAQRWQEAHDVLARAAARFPEDTDLLYEQAMMAEKLGRVEAMEQLLRRVIELRPDNAHAYNALGYTLADRGKRLDEAKTLIERALTLSPGDPFITDSLGWVEFRLGNREAALAHLQRAWATRPDTEIGAHLGEVLWAMGRQDEARRIWREARGRDAANEVLRETLARLRVQL